MREIEMDLAPDGTWIMVCPCGQTETRGRGAKGWLAFKATMLPGDRYRVTCQTCRRYVEHRLRYGVGASRRLGPS